MGSYGIQSVPTGQCVHFVDEQPELADLVELVESLQEKHIRTVYVDCQAFVGRTWELPNDIALQAGTDHPPYDESHETNWVRWWDDMLTLGSRLPGLVIVLDNAFTLFESDRKFVTNLIENFLHAMRPWMKSDLPYHLCLQMVSSPSVREAFLRASAYRET